MRSSVASSVSAWVAGFSSDGGLNLPLGSDPLVEFIDLRSSSVTTRDSSSELGSPLAAPSVPPSEMFFFFRSRALLIWWRVRDPRREAWRMVMPWLMASRR